MEPDEMIDALLLAYDDKDIQLSAWEAEFLSSFDPENDQGFTDKQLEKVKEIYDAKLG